MTRPCSFHGGSLIEELMAKKKLLNLPEETFIPMGTTAREVLEILKKANLDKFVKYQLTKDETPKYEHGLKDGKPINFKRPVDC